MNDTNPTEGQGGASNDAGKPTPAAGRTGIAPGENTSELPVEEARIIEETVIKPPPLKSGAPPPQPSAPPPPPVPPSAPSIRKETPAPNTFPQVPLPKIEVPLPPPSSTPPAPPKMPTPLEVPVKAQNEQEAIANILKEIKLPERRDVPGKEQVASAPRVFDTTLGTVPPRDEAQKVKPPEVSQDPVPAPEISPKTPEVPRAPDEPLPPPGERDASTTITPLRTLKQDLQHVVRDKKISLVKAVALESEKKHGADNEEWERTQATHSRRTFGTLFAIALLVVLGAAAFFGVYLINGGSGSVPRNETDASILFSENTVSFPLGNGVPLELKRMLAEGRLGTDATLGSITRVIPFVSTPDTEGNMIERPASLEEFLTKLGTRAPADLTRALSKDFFFGFHTVDENAPLFMIPVLSYEHAFAGMLAWEQTMNADLSPAFTPVPDQVVGSGGLPEKRRFEDVVMRNYDARALKDDSGEIELYYSFPTRGYLIIAESAYSFGEILNRLRAERKL